MNYSGLSMLDASMFDSSTANYTGESFVSEVRTKTENILRKEFPDNYIKQKIKKDASGLALACPYCGDSFVNSSKKRGHILLTGKYAGYYKCFNCGKFTPVYKFFTDFSENLSLAGIKFTNEHRIDIRTSMNNASDEITADVFCKTLAIQYGINREAFKTILSLIEIEKIGPSINAYNYLCSRHQYNFNKFLYDVKDNAIVIMNIVENKVIGYQKRMMNPDIPKDKRFLTYNLEKIYKTYFNAPNIQIPEQLNTVSTLFNIYEINVYKPIIVTEGPMDAFLLPNAIATSGANKKLTVELPFWYMFDADATGNRHAAEKLRSGSKVFLWGKLKSDLKLPQRDKWDVNDIVNWGYDTGNYQKIDWLKYFSDNLLDMIYLDDLRMKL